MCKSLLRKLSKSDVSKMAEYSTNSTDLTTQEANAFVRNPEISEEVPVP